MEKIQRKNQSQQAQYFSSIHADMVRDKNMIADHLRGFEELDRKTKKLLKSASGQRGTAWKLCSPGWKKKLRK